MISDINMSTILSYMYIEVQLINARKTLIKKINKVIKKTNAKYWLYWSTQSVIFYNILIYFIGIVLLYIYIILQHTNFDRWWAGPGQHQKRYAERKQIKTINGAHA